MMRKIFITFIVLFLFSFVHAQKFSGTIVDKNGDPIVLANIVELTKDSLFIIGTTTNTDGLFTIDKGKDASILRISSIGYTNLFLPISSKQGDEDFGKVVMDYSDTMLSEVLIKASRPLFKQKGSSIYTQVKGTVLSKLNTMDDLLPQLPGAIKGLSGGIEIFGKGSPIIYINKRPMRLDSELERLVPSDIKDIELITSPGPEYNASGRAVIKITTINKNEGFSFLSKTNLKQSDYMSGGQNVILGYQFQKLSVAGNLGYKYNHGRLSQPASTELPIGNKLHRYDKGQWGETRTPAYNYQLSVDYDINDKNSVGLSFDGTQNTNKECRKGTLDYLVNNIPTNSAIIDNHYKNKVNYQHINTFYDGTFGRVNTTLNADYVHNENDYTQNTIENHPKLPSINTYSIGNGKQDMLAMKLEWKLSISPQTYMVWGAEIGYTNSNGYLSISSANKVNSDYKTQENKYAAFVELTKSIKDLTLSGGLRYEDYTYRYDNMIVDNTLHKHYKHLFPSFRASFDNGSWNHTLVFSSQINRPTFRQMSNASYYGNEYMYQQGNPRLAPSKLYSMQYYAAYKFIKFSVEYTHRKDYIALNFYNNGKDNIVVSTYKNFPTMQNINAYVNLQKKWGIWSPSLSLGISQPFFKCDYRGEEKKHNKASAYMVFNQFFQLPHNYMLSSYVYYNTGGNQGAVRLTPFHSIDFGLQKSFLSNKLVISLNAKDVFHGMKFKETELLDAFYFTQTEDYHLWNYSLNITYRINSKKTKYRGKSALDSDIKRL
ncbi:MAG: outer membrane beta-barrel family protein [Phocaeicola sp.]|uniref:outer membrane beta-barrel family protein n=1 Tax=Phocaeicola sp. TaxID=2773926 RepID=UPI003F9F08DB